MTRFTAALLTAAALPTTAALGLMASSRLEAQEAPLDRAATEEIVREYILENPEVIVEALERWRDNQDMLAASQAEMGALDNLPLLLSGDAGVALGADVEDTEVLVVEFFDYHCGYCRRATDFVMGLAEQDGVRVVFQDLPILRTESRNAALAGLAAAESGDYEDMHRQLMRSSGVLNEEVVAKAAERADASRAVDALQRADVRQRLEAKLDSSVEIARAMGLSGTPTFVVADPTGKLVRVVPAYAPEEVEAAIAEVRAL